MTRRKPVPTLNSNEHDDRHDHKEHELPLLPVQHSPFADPQIRRYTLTDGPSTPNSTNTFNSEQADISQAVDQLLKSRYSTVTDPNDGGLDGAPLLLEEGRSLSRSSSDSGVTVMNSRDRNGGSDDSHTSSTIPPPLPQRAPTVPPYQPGQLLPTIVTGETLNLDEFGQEIPHDPFMDVPQLPQVPLPTTQPYAHYDPEYQDPLTLPPVYLSESYQYAPPHEDPAERYRYVEPEPLPAGSRSGFVDHFQHDTEAYASGNFSRASYRPPRSRSPTPAVDDEDYHIVGNDSVHYTGYPTPEIPGWDPEKAVFEESGFLNEKYADAFGQDPMYDDEDIEKTPVTSVNFLEPDSIIETRHFGPAPTGRIHRRHKSKKRVQLTNGNLVVDINVPPKMVLPYRGEPEMTTTRYTAVTCDPDEFEKSGFFLRQNETGRRTELFIVITMYNVSFIRYHLFSMS